jgi:hypothetical protein
MESLALLTIAVVLSVAIGVAAARLRDHRHQRIRIAEAATEEVALSVESRLVGHAPTSTPSGTGGRREELDDIILALLSAEPNVYTKTALARQVGSGYATVLKRIVALQDEGRVVPNVRGAKLSLARPDEESETTVE